MQFLIPLGLRLLFNHWRVIIRAPLDFDTLLPQILFHDAISPRRAASCSRVSDLIPTQRPSGRSKHTFDAKHSTDIGISGNMRLHLEESWLWNIQFFVLAEAPSRSRKLQHGNGFL